ncbi:19511_t:CDS:2 [Dentiscutata erythropus]|uniref:19511_t:CDS:1 n=1 Tax=Dentiscutata erythropus TaxID=1348616 RepID=A0A9N9APH1_9GLOM|nr:19511_t:CDS:2 [Dentiscutata erythropus]
MRLHEYLIQIGVKKNVLLRLSTKAKKLNTTSLTLVNDDNYEIETCDLTTLASDASESEEKLDLNFNEKGYHEREYNFNDDESLSSEEVEYEYNYSVFIKSENRTSLPAKWYIAKVSTVDKLLSKIHINIETLMGNKLVDPNDYRIAFKSEKAAGADNNIVSDSRNKNSISKTSNLSSLELSIAKNVLEICKENHCIIYNRPCLNKNGAKENHIKITFIMFSIWNKAMASLTEPPTHPLFTYKHLTKTKTSSQLQSTNLIQQANLMQQASLIQQSLFLGQHYIPNLFYNPFSTYNSFGIPFSTPIQLSLQQTLSIIENFLKFVDESKNTKDYYQKFLSKFKQ